MTTQTPTFDDGFKKLSLWDNNNGIWQPAMWYSPDGYTTSDLSSWVVSPIWGPTSGANADVYSVSNGVLSLGFKPTPTSLLPYVDNQQFLSGQLTTYTPLMRESEISRGR